MEAYREEALRLKHIAERRFVEKDFTGARSYALKARSLFPDLEGLTQMIATFEVYVASQSRSGGGGQIDYYQVLGLKPSAGKTEVKKQYKKMAVLLHPDKNKCVGADGAFHLISEAWNFFSSEFNKSTFYYKRKKHIDSTVVQKQSTEYMLGTGNNAAGGFDRFPPSSERPDTFWTVCTSCKVQYEYLRKYVNKRLSCKNCRGAFVAVETGSAPVCAPFLYTPSSHAPPPPPPPSSGYGTHSYDALARMPTNSTYILGHYPGQRHGYDEYAVNGSYEWSPYTGTNHDLQHVSSVSNGYPYKHSTSVVSPGINRAKDGFSGTCSTKSTSGRPILSVQGTATKVGRSGKKSKAFTESSGNGFVETSLKSASVSKTSNVDSNSEHDNKPHRQSSTWRWSAASVIDTRTPLVQKARADIKQRLEIIRLASEAAAAAAAENSTPLDEKTVGACKSVEVTGHKSNGPITVPDSDFHDFDKNRTEESFEPRQIWAIYDEDDGMPRLYCVVREVLSVQPFKIDIAYLSSKTDIEFGSMKWVQYGFTKSCGHFRIRNSEVVEQVNIFSHLLRGKKTGRGGCVRIFPKTGEIWAVYKNWSLNWNETTSEEVRHQYEMVEILDEYTEQYGVCVVPLVKLEGYKTVYHRSTREEESKKWIPRSEMLRFSHQVPSWFLKDSTSGFPGNCWDLDPAAIPEELLHKGAGAN